MSRSTKSENKHPNPPSTNPPAGGAARKPNPTRPLAVSAPPCRLKVLSLGSGAVGKSCIIKRYCEERFVSKYIATIGIDYGVKPVSIDGVDVRVNFWDLSGHSEFFEIRNEFYKDVQAIMLVYDSSLRESFDDLENWLAEATKYGANVKELPIALCANKADKKRVVGEEEGRAFANSKNMMYFETSAATGAGINEMFDYLFQSALRRLR